MIVKTLEWAIIKSAEGCRRLLAQRTPIPERPGSAMLLGTVSHPYYPERSEEAVIDRGTRLRHLYCLGATGHGKTKFIEVMVRQDLLMDDDGCALIDPHGDLTQNILRFLASTVPAEEIDELGNRLILIEPFNRDYAIGFNPLEGHGQPFPAMLELLEIFRRFWGNTWGPRLDELLRNSILTLSQNNLTLLEARPLLTHAGFRQRMLENISFGEVKDYWLHRYNGLSDKMQAMYREPLLNKVSAFVTDPSICRIIGQRESTINFRQAMDQGKWILLNLSKGQLKLNTGLLGTLFLLKIKQAAFSRADIPEEERAPYFVYLDEFQNFIGEDVEEILSEARKYKLGLTLAHQTLDQIPKELRSAILGNVGTEILFRLSHHDAVQVSSELDQKEKSLIERRLIDLKPREAYLKIKGQKPKLLKTPYVSSTPVSQHTVEMLKRASFQHWARPVVEVEREIEERKRLWRGDLGIMTPLLRDSGEDPFEDQSIITPDGLYEEGQDGW